MQFKIGKAHSIHAKRQGRRGWPWNSHPAVTRSIELAFLEPAGEIRKVKIDGKDFNRTIPNLRVLEARKRVSQLFEDFALFLGVSKSAAVHAFLTESVGALQRAVRHGEEGELFKSRLDAAWEKANACFLGDRSSMEDFLNKRWSQVVSHTKISPESAKREAQELLLKWAEHLADKASRNVEDAVAYAYAKLNGGDVAHSPT